MSKSKNMLINAICLYTVPEVIKFSAMFSGLTEVLEGAMSSFVNAVSGQDKEIDLHSFFDDELDGLVVDVLEQLHNQTDALISEYGELLETLESKGKLKPAFNCINHFSKVLPDLSPLDNICTPRELLGYLSFLNEKDPQSKALLEFLDSFDPIFKDMEQKRQKELEEEQKNLEKWFAATEDNDVIKLISLFEKGVDIDITNQQGRTALAHAVVNNSLEVANILISYNANPDANISDNSPLHLAIKQNMPDFVAALLCSENEELDRFQWENYINISWSDYINDEYADVIRHLVAFYNEKINYSAAAKAAIDNDAILILEILFDHALDANDDTFSTPLIFEAIEKGNASVIALLIDNGADLNAKNWHRITLLEAAINDSPSEIIELLIENDAKLDDGNHNANMALLNKLSEKTDKTIEEIFKLELFDVNAYGNFPYNFLHALVSQYNEDSEIPENIENVISILINDMGMDINQATKQEYGYDTALTLVDNEKIFDCLLQHNPDFEHTYQSDETLFDKIKYLFDGQAIVKLLKAGANPNMTVCKLPLIHYCLKESKDYLDAIIDSEPDIDILDSKGYTVLQKYISDKDLIEPYLIRFAEAGADFSLNTVTGLPIFHALCANYEEELISKIVDITSCDINVSDQNNNNAIMQACLARNLSALEYLVNTEVSVNQKNILGVTPFLHAVYTDDVELVDLLINKWRIK